MDGEVVARVDLKANRQASVLHVQRAHLEPGAPDGTAERCLRFGPRVAATPARLASVPPARL
jgi:uncharacterized protein YcaQ